ncbi:hypothetical protein SAMN05444673_6356 [Bacillus sp. OV166]|uniref:hypothetical protein n=1 Tax=Bacillus sp. OV166 TaxID=1882763 RepID=UPI000A2ACAFC|nr:hypothetical protein [Bacillus sp. OV166]SMQ85053.1 hypothetical protein SAMN05444673_6356 [Bacillus sp. OV166]
MGKGLVVVGVVVAASLIVTPMNNRALAKSNQSNTGNHYGWTEGNGNHYGLIKKGKISQEPVEQPVTYTAEDIITSKRTIQENQTVNFENYIIKLNEDGYSVTKNGLDIASGSASDSTVKLWYDPAGNYITLNIINNTAESLTSSIPLILAITEDTFTSGTGLLLGVADNYYGDLCYFKGNYVYWDKSKNTVTITKDGTVIEEYQYISIENVMIYNSWDTGKIGLYINDNLVYTF